MARILLAEDDESMRCFLQTALERAGHEATAAQDGLAALEILEKNQNYDLLLTDIVMPGIDGIELSQRVSKLCPAIKIMFITGFAAVAISKHKNELKGAKLLSKPFHLNDLVEKIDLLLKAA